jgi:hypothetical protein
VKPHKGRKKGGRKGRREEGEEQGRKEGRKERGREGGRRKERKDVNIMSAKARSANCSPRAKSNPSPLFVQPMGQEWLLHSQMVGKKKKRS